MVGAGGGRLVMWSVVGVLHFHWSVFIFENGRGSVS